MGKKTEKKEVEKTILETVIGIILIILLILAALFIIAILIYGMYDAEKEEDQRIFLCKQNGLYYETYGASTRMCCKILEDGGILCYKIEELGKEYYLQRNYKDVVHNQEDEINVVNNSYDDSLDTNRKTCIQDSASSMHCDTIIFKNGSEINYNCWDDLMIHYKCYNNSDILEIREDNIYG